MKSSIALSAAALALALNTQAAVVFQADFNGTGTGTGGVSDIVSLGGTGAINNVNPSESNVTVTVDSSTPLSSGSGSYLSLNDTGIYNTTNRAAGVTLTPSSAASGFDSWYSNTSGTLGWDTLNGGFDFLFRTSSSADLAGGSLRLISVGGSTGYALTINSVATDRILVQLSQNNSALVQTYSPINSPLNFVAGATYRIAVTVSTNATNGLVTVNLYMASGDTTIDTSQTTHLLRSTTSSVAADAGNSISSSFNSTSGFTFGQVGNADSDVKVLDLDTFRIYDSVPATFAASSIPEPGSFAAVMGAVAAMGACVRRRRR